MAEVQQGKTFTDLKALNSIDGSSLLAVHYAGETYKMTYSQLLASVSSGISKGAVDEIGMRFFSDRKSAPNGCLSCMNGAIYPTADIAYPELWQKILEGKLKYVTMEEYEVSLARRFGKDNSLTGVSPLIGVDIAKKTFRMPTYPSSRIAMTIGDDFTFNDGQIINLTGGWMTFDRGNNWGHGSTFIAGRWSARVESGGGDNWGSHANFDSSRQVKVGDQIRVPSSSHCLYMIVSSVRWEVSSVYVNNLDFQNEVVARTDGDVKLKNALSALSDKVSGALSSYYKDTYKELTDFVLDNSSILQIGNILICGGGETGEPVRQFIWSGTAMLEVSANIVFDNYYTKTQIDNITAEKVDKIPGKVLSSNDYTAAEKIKLAQAVSGPEYEAFKGQTETKLGIVQEQLDREVINRTNNDIIGGTTTGTKDTADINPILVLKKGDDKNISIGLDVLNEYVNKTSIGDNGDTVILNQNQVKIDGEESPDDGGLTIKDIRKNDNSITLLKTYRQADNPVNLELSLKHITNSSDSVRLLLLNNGTNKKVFLLKNKGSNPLNISEADPNDEVMNRGEIWSRIEDVVSQAIQGVLPIPTVIKKESNLPDISSGASKPYYFAIEDMDVSHPQSVRQGRAWCGIKEKKWNVIVDLINVLSTDSFKQEPSGEWNLADSIKETISNSVQASQISTSITDASTNQEIPTSKAANTSLKLKIDKSSIEIEEPSEESTDETLTSSKRLKLMMGNALNTLKTTTKNIVGSLNELFDNKASISLANLNQEGIDRVAALSSGMNSNSLGQIIYSILPIDDLKVLLAQGQLVGQTGEYQQFSEYLHKLRLTYPSVFCTQPEWDISVNTHGKCSKFVIDDVAFTIRLPLLKGIIKGVTNIEDLGKLNGAGLPNITGDVGAVKSDIPAAGAFGLEGGFTGGNTNTAAQQFIRSNFNASRSSSIYGRSNTVEVEGYNGLIYIVVGTTGQISVDIHKDYEIYNTVPLGCPIYSDHLLEDMNYIISVNQWYLGERYQALYNLLLSQYNNPSSKTITKTIGQYEIAYKHTPLGYYISESDNVELIFAESKVPFWKIDIANNQFKLPQNNKRTLIERKVNSNNWYEIYSDGWCRQGGIEVSVANLNGVLINLLVPMADTNYVISASSDNSTNLYDGGTVVSFKNKTPTNITFLNSYNIGNLSKWYAGNFTWKVEGYTNVVDNIFDPNKYLYYKVGNTTVNAELIDLSRLELNKVNLDGGNAVFNHLSPEAKNNIFRCSMPDYNRKEVIAAPLLNVNYRQGYNTYVGLRIGSNSGFMQLIINGVEQEWMQDGSSAIAGSSMLIPLPANTLIRFKALAGAVNLTGLTFYRILGDS